MFKIFKIVLGEINEDTYTYCIHSIDSHSHVRTPGMVAESMELIRHVVIVHSVSKRESTGSAEIQPKWRQMFELERLPGFRRNYPRAISYRVPKPCGLATNLKQACTYLRKPVKACRTIFYSSE